MTGGAGYIGSHTVVELHKAGYKPVIVDNFSNSNPMAVKRLETITGEKIPFFELDCRFPETYETILKAHPEISGVIHFAAFKAVGESVQFPLKYYNNNVSSLVTLLEAMETHAVNRLVFSSSCTVYGEPDQLPVTEDSEIKEATSPYGYSKQVCERMIHDTGKSYENLSASILRYFNPIGAHPSGLIGELPNGVPNNLVPFVTQVAAGWREELTIYGNNYSTPDGTCIRDYIHVVDLANAHVSALKWCKNNQGECGVFNIGTGNGNSVQEVVDAFQKVNGVGLNVKVGPRRKGDVEKIFASAEKASKELGWESQHSLEEALEHAWKWQTNLKQE